MNCLSDSQIQEYIDEEISSEEKLELEDHLAHCEKCRMKIIQQEQFVNQFITDWGSDLEEIPVPPFKPKNMPLQSKKMKVRRFIWTGAAALIILYLFTYSPSRKTTSKEPQSHHYLEFEYEIDANKPWAEQEIYIHFSEPSTEEENLN